ncbi:MAG TPA: alpha/beta fold hydrolase [Ktedonobacteraceae bacterium]|jgi:surfactin synthase thioesterase subunit
MAKTTNADLWLPWPSMRPRAQLRLFCFPYAGGSASDFCTWLRELPSAIDVRPVQIPGRERRLREKPYEQLTPLVAAVAHALLPHLTEPFAFFGHCLGALIAFELSRQIRAWHGRQPVALFVSGHRAPQLPDRFPPSHRLPDAEFASELRRRNGAREEMLQSPGVVRQTLPLLRADQAICETYLYIPGESLDCPLTVFGGRADQAVQPEELTGWAEQTRGPCRLHVLPGDHFFLQTNRPQILQRLSHDLSQAMAYRSRKRAT